MGDCQILATYFAGKYSSKVVVHTPNAKLLVAKLAAAPVFLEPAANWKELLGAHSGRSGKPLGVTCNCKCGCNCSTSSTRGCGACFKMCCGNCLARTNSDVPRCHVCLKLPKLDGQLEPPSPTCGLRWYFNHPCDAREFPDILCNPNRDTNLDPPLVEVIQLSKCRWLEKDGRNVRPYNWESAFRIQVHLADADGGVVLVNMSYFCFIMNPKWNRDPIVNFVEKWLRPETFSFMGIVRRNDITYVMEPLLELPAPKSPYGLPGLDESGPESEEEEQTPAVKARREKEEKKELLERYTMPTPGVQFEDVDETERVRAMQALGATSADFHAAGLGNHPEVLAMFASSSAGVGVGSGVDSKRRRTE
jgi:hypothetical protein